MIVTLIQGPSCKPQLMTGPNMAIGVVLRLCGNLDNAAQVVALR